MGTNASCSCQPCGEDYDVVVDSARTSVPVLTPVQANPLFKRRHRTLASEYHRTETQTSTRADDTDKWPVTSPYSEGNEDVVFWRVE